MEWVHLGFHLLTLSIIWFQTRIFANTHLSTFHYHYSLPIIRHIPPSITKSSNLHMRQQTHRTDPQCPVPSLIDFCLARTSRITTAALLHDVNNFTT